MRMCSLVGGIGSIEVRSENEKGEYKGQGVSGNFLLPPFYSGAILTHNCRTCQGFFILIVIIIEINGKSFCFNEWIS